MALTPLHNWDITPKQAVALQRELAGQVIHDRSLDLNAVRTVAGVDVSVSGGRSTAAIVVLAFPAMTVLETVISQMDTPFPYIPGLLSFREGPVLVDALSRLNHTPDVFIFDGMGRIHPRRIGIASHMGLWLGRPTVGCGKTHFIGEYDAPGPHKGDRSDLIDGGERLGVVLRTRARVKPVYVSPGHLSDIESAAELVLACTSRYRLPEPIRHAHRAAGDHGQA